MLTNGEISGCERKHRLGRLLVRVCAAAVVAIAISGQANVAAAEERSLSFYNAHTKERATIVYKRNGRYDQAGLNQLNRFLRDWRLNKSIKMDPKLFDVLWEVYGKTGAKRPITVVCGYRAPETNAMLRRRSNGVAQNSQHTKGKAIDFYIPGVDLAALRAAGLRAEAGGVGFYPTSGSPFVHIDTGSVRHWPRMSRSQLVKVFPDGKTLHVPTDGKPLPGYAQALAAYKVRQATGVAVAKYSGAPAADEDEDVEIEIVSAEEVPLPRRAPRAEVTGAVTVASAAIVEDPTGGNSPFLSYPPEAAGEIDAQRFTERFAAAEQSVPLDPLALAIMAAAFETAHEVPAPSAPADLLSEMAKRQTPGRSPSTTTSLPIQPTAVVATVDVGVDLSRPLRADAITTAVLRGNDDRLDVTVPPILAYAAARDDGGTADETAATDGITTFGVPLPQSNPMRMARATSLAAPKVPAEVAIDRSTGAIYHRLFPAELTLTKLDTQGLRLWIATPSTREKRYALLTMPDYSQALPVLLGKPDTTFAARFGSELDAGPRTDRFDGAVVVSPAIVDLTTNQTIAAR